MRQLARLGIGFLFPVLWLSSYPVAGLADTPSIPAGPTALAMSLPESQQALAAGSWISRKSIILKFSVPVGSAPLTPQVEVQPSSTPFTEQPTSAGQPLTAAGEASITVSGLVNGKTYHWQARVTDSAGNVSQWTAYATGAATSTADFGVDLTAPSRPIIFSSTNPNPNLWYNSVAVQLQWQSRDGISGVKGYTYQLERQAHVIPPRPTVPDSSVTLRGLADGVWFLAVRAEDRASNWSPTATFKFALDRQPPHLTWVGPNRVTFNPNRGPVSVGFRSSKNASVRLSLYRVGAKDSVAAFTFPNVVAGRTVTFTWSGRDAHNNLMPKGYYFFSAVAIDRASNAIHANLGGISLDPTAPVRTPSGFLLFPDDGKVIVVSLRLQTLFAYDGLKLAMQTLVTTGNPSLPTPPGDYKIMAKYHPFEFISPWPPGSPDWYAPSWTQYAMLFRDGGYFLHDAPWRTVYGPGTNGPGQPGTNYGGTHGCVNIPPGPTFFLWNWAPIGTRVVVVP